MDEFTATSVTLIGIGTISIGSLVLLQVQAIKTLWPGLEGQAAMFVVLFVSLFSTAVALDRLGMDWSDRNTAFALYFGTLTVFIAAIAQYALLFKVSVRGAPPSSEASVPASAVNDPQAEPYAAETRKPIAHTRAMTDGELLDVARRRPQ